MKDPRNVTEALVWAIAEQLVSAVAYMHAHSIVHRDIKPLNIFLDRERRVKLGDLGVSKIMSEQAEGTRVGTPLFLAPELVQQKPYSNKVTART